MPDFSDDTGIDLLSGIGLIGRVLERGVHDSHHPFRSHPLRQRLWDLLATKLTLAAYQPMLVWATHVMDHWCFLMPSIVSRVLGSTVNIPNSIAILSKCRIYRLTSGWPLYACPGVVIQ